MRFSNVAVDRITLIKFGMNSRDVIKRFVNPPFNDINYCCLCCFDFVGSLPY